MNSKEMIFQDIKNWDIVKEHFFSNENKSNFKPKLVYFAMILIKFEGHIFYINFFKEGFFYFGIKYASKSKLNKLNKLIKLLKFEIKLHNNYTFFDSEEEIKQKLLEALERNIFTKEDMPCLI